MSTDHIDNVKNEIEKLIDVNPYDAHEVAYGCKHSGGVFTEEKCIRFGVEKKIPLDQIPERNRLICSNRFSSEEELRRKTR